MSIDMFWRRLAPAAIDGLAMWDLAELVPTWLDEPFEGLRERGELAAAEDSAELAGRLLVLGAGDGPHAPAARLFARSPRNFDDEAMVGFYFVDEVAAIAGLLAAAPAEVWAAQHQAALAEAAERLGFWRPFTPEWSASIVATIEELTALFTTAAREGEIVLVLVVA